MKKLLSLTLTLIFMLNLLAVPAFASETRDFTAIEEKAIDLKKLGLFKGVSDTDFDLERAPSRTEALIILIRILGKEAEAINGTYTHPFTDVETWADQYIGYAYTTGLTKGVSETEFGSANANAATFLTFVLRALGYTDADGKDFTWNNPFELAQGVGILTDDVDLESFLRADAVIVAHNALSANMKDSTVHLSEKLISDGVFTAEQYGEVFPSDGENNEQTGTSQTPEGGDTGTETDTPTVPEEKTPLSAKEIFEKCSPAVFSITTYDIAGNAYALGSGFFIDSDGTAVTNAHIFTRMANATVTLADGTVHEIESVLKMDGANDFVMLKVEGDNFPTLAVGDSTKLAAGEDIYTIGNPRGLSNSISDGIVSNPKRVEYNNWIQITAPISGGSSGGALINEYGEVIGVTTASMVDGQNLNFAIPIEAVTEGENAFIKIGITEPLSFNDFVVFVALADYTSIVGQPTTTYFESEPNDTADNAPYLYSGETIYGMIDYDESGASDVVLVPINVPGKITVVLMSPMAYHAKPDQDEYKQLCSDSAKQIDLVLKKANDSDVIISGTEFTQEGITVKVIEEYEIEAGLYALDVSSDTIYQDGFNYEAPILHDYIIYYVFIPDYSGLSLSDEYIAKLEGTDTEIDIEP